MFTRRNADMIESILTISDKHAVMFISRYSIDAKTKNMEIRD